MVLVPFGEDFCGFLKTSFDFRLVCLCILLAPALTGASTFVHAGPRQELHIQWGPAVSRRMASSIIGPTKIEPILGARPNNRGRGQIIGAWPDTRGRG